jgi:hypothetical protein
MPLHGSVGESLMPGNSYVHLTAYEEGFVFD